LSFGGYKATLLADPTNPQDAATKAYVDTIGQSEGGADFSALVGDYTIPNGAWGTPGWYSPIVVGPNQIWEITACAAQRCVTAVHLISHAITFRDASGAALSAAYNQAGRVSQMQPPAITQNYTDLIIGRLATDGTVPANTTVRIQQQFNGGGANGRVLRDGTYYWVQAWRRF
jgi:hypothetical protein